MKIRQLFSRKGGEGFSLLEVIASIAILGIGITLVAQLISGALRSAFMSRKYIMAVTHAKSKLGEIFLEGILEPGNDSGEFPDEGDYQWKTEISLYERESAEEESEDEEKQIELYRINVRVLFHEQGTEKSVDLSTLRVQVKKPDGLL